MINSAKLQDAVNEVEVLAAFAGIDQATKQRVLDAVPAFAAAVDSGTQQKHLHTGLLNVTVTNIDGVILLRFNAKKASGRSKVVNIELNQ